MKVRDSGMPSEETWEGFFDAPSVLAALAFPAGKADVVDFGCGYGTFTTAAASLTSGTVHALDIDPAMIRATALRVASLGLANVRLIERDFVSGGSTLPGQSADYAMLFNILHAEAPLTLLLESFRILRPNGKVAVIHWIHDRTTPRGPDLAIRPRPEECRQWMQSAGFVLLVREVALPPYHYGIVGQRPSATLRQGTV
jgi:ubiquinone/menaquinone biosynthesis C-methylase UbiE